MSPVRAGSILSRAVVVARAHRAHRATVEELDGAPWDDPSAMDSLRLERLRASVSAAASSSPFYRRVLGPGRALPASLEELAALPITSKADLKASELDRAIPGPPRDRETWRTSGSSGEPMVFAVDRTAAARHDAQRAWVYRRVGLVRGSLVVELLDGDHRVVRPTRGYPSFRRVALGADAPGLLDAVRAALAREAEPRRRLLYGDRSVLLQLADELGDRADGLAAAFVCNSSETLHPPEAERLSRLLTAEILDIYGSAEAGNLAFRLGGSPWTILEPRVVVEIVVDGSRPAMPGELGEIVVTTLTEPTAPLIRYATGDLARVEAGHGSGRSGLRLAALEGRSADSVIDHLGRRVSFWAIATSTFWASDDVAIHLRRWQVHQCTDRSLRVSLELAPDGDLDAVRRRIERHIHEVVGPLGVVVTACDRVHDPASGKFRAVTSDADT